MSGSWRNESDSGTVSEHPFGSNIYYSSTHKSHTLISLSSLSMEPLLHVKAAAGPLGPGALPLSPYLRPKQEQSQFPALLLLLDLELIGTTAECDEGLVRAGGEQIMKDLLSESEEMAGLQISLYPLHSHLWWGTGLYWPRTAHHLHSR